MKDGPTVRLAIKGWGTYEAGATAAPPVRLAAPTGGAAYRKSQGDGR